MLVVVMIRIQMKSLLCSDLKGFILWFSVGPNITIISIINYYFFIIIIIIIIIFIYYFSTL